MKTGTKRDPYMAIMHAAANGRGLHLSAEEVLFLSMDSAIDTAASNTLDTDSFAELEERRSDFWRSKKPYPRGSAANLAGYSEDDPRRL